MMSHFAMKFIQVGAWVVKVCGGALLNDSSYSDAYVWVVYGKACN